MTVTIGIALRRVRKGKKEKLVTAAATFLLIASWQIFRLTLEPMGTVVSSGLAVNAEREK